MRRAWLLLALVCGGCAAPLAGIVPAGQRLSLDVAPLDGRSERLELEAGRRHLVVFWASWCARCRPAVLQTAGLTDVEVHAVSVDSDARQARLAAEAWGLADTMWDREAVAATRLGVRRLPTLVLTDGDGRIRHVFEGWDESVASHLRGAVVAGTGR